MGTEQEIKNKIAEIRLIIAGLEEEYEDEVENDNDRETLDNLDNQIDGYDEDIIMLEWVLNK